MFSLHVGLYSKGLEVSMYLYRMYTCVYSGLCWSVTKFQSYHAKYLQPTHGLTAARSVARHSPKLVNPSYVPKALTFDDQFHQ